MNSTPRWLTGCIVMVVSSTVFLSVAWWGACTFYIGPQLWSAYVRSAGKLATTEPQVCSDADARALAVLSGLLATLIGLRSSPPEP